MWRRRQAEEADPADAGHERCNAKDHIAGQAQRCAMFDLAMQSIDAADAAEDGAAKLRKVDDEPIVIE